jgi:beta-galactosidase
MALLPRLPRLCFGGDYNPEQWPPAVWRDDVTLMNRAGVTLVTVGVFAWAQLEPAAGRYTFDWLDEVVDLLGEHDIKVDLATATASPPPWFSHAYPQTLPVDANGRRLSYGSRQAYCPSSPIYRDAAVRLAGRLAERYGRHPALALWHVGNEYGCEVPHCFCDVSAAAFRSWLRRRYDDDLDTLNAAWGTAFWSQRYTDWEQIIPPRATPAFGNPTQALDFRRFSSDELLDCYRAERDALRRITPDIPITTNLMAGMSWELDYWAWSRELDVVSTDHYLRPEFDPVTDIAFAADLTRSLAGGRPWLLMEHSTSAVNWQARNLAKIPGQLRRDALTYVARGSDGAMFFQWRASVAGAEKFHSAMVSHAGTDTRIWRECTELGDWMTALAEVAGAEVEPAQVALLLDWSSLWAGWLPAHPTVDLDPAAELRAWHAALHRAGVTADFAHPTADLSAYRLVLAPAQYLLDDAGSANLHRYVSDGGCLVVGPFSGVVDACDRVVRPGRLNDLLGAWTEEFYPLPADGTVPLDDGGTGRVWSERTHPTGAGVEVRYADDPTGYPGAALAGSPALTRHGYGRGQVWYLTTLPDAATRSRWTSRFIEAGDLTPTGWAGVEAVRRRQPSGQSYLFLINHGADDVTGHGAGTDLLTGATADGTVRVPARGVVVLREPLAGAGSKGAA